MLNLLEGFDLRAMGRNSPDTLHTMIEAKKIVWADRAKFYADPAFAKIPVAQLISKQYAAERRKLIDPQHAAKKIEAGNPDGGHASSVSPPTEFQSVVSNQQAESPLAETGRDADLPSGDTIY